MPTIRAATIADLPSVASYLSSRFRGEGGANRYRRFFEYPWLSDRPNIGFLLEDAGQVRGFVGAIYSRRTIRGEMHQLCNLNSWSVDEEHRRLSLLLVKRLIDQPGYTVTCFSPSEKVTGLLAFFKFKTWTSEKVLLTPINGLRSALRSPRVRVLTPGRGLEEELDDVERGIYEDHRSYRCGHMLLVRGDRRSYVVTVRRGRGQRAFADVLYASDPALLVESIAHTHWPLFRAHGTFVTGVDRRFVKELPPAVYVYRGLRPIQYLTRSLDLTDIDTLYSELVPMYG
jgi:hypothetical protein